MGGPVDMPDMDVGSTAFFFDFDGTLVDIAPEPHLVRVDALVRQALTQLQQLADGAVAVVSGREIAQIDKYLAPLVLPAAGVHGVEIRGADGRIARDEADELALEDVRQGIEAFVALHEGLLAEIKRGSIALHYRQRPDLQAACMAFAAKAEAQGRFHVLHGKMVIEFKASPLTKGTAIATLMSQPPFRGRRPFFVGDDVTDEHGFLAVNRLGGISMKVGSGETQAHFRCEGVAAFARWLAAIAGLNADTGTEGMTRSKPSRAPLAGGAEA